MSGGRGKGQMMKAIIEKDVPIDNIIQVLPKTSLSCKDDEITVTKIYVPVHVGLANVSDSTNMSA